MFSQHKPVLSGVWVERPPPLRPRLRQSQTKNHSTVTAAVAPGHVTQVRDASPRPVLTSLCCFRERAEPSGG